MTEPLDDRRSEAAPLIRDDPGETEASSLVDSKPELKVGCDFCCNPTRPCYRYLALLFMCFMGFGELTYFPSIAP
jgi:hypothetical protein